MLDIGHQLHVVVALNDAQVVQVEHLDAVAAVILGRVAGEARRGQGLAAIPGRA